MAGRPRSFICWSMCLERFFFCVWYSCFRSIIGSWVEGLAPGNVAKQIADLHTIFNLVTSLTLLPLSGLLVRVAKWQF